MFIPLKKFNFKKHFSQPLWLIFIFYGFGWVIGYIPIYKFSKGEIKKQIDKVWYKAISSDCKMRLIETELEYTRKPSSTENNSSNVVFETGNGIKEFNKDTIISPRDSEEREHRLLQSILLEKKPIKVVILDSLFRTNLKVEGISAPTAITYINVNNKQTERSTTDSTFYKQALATAEIKTGIDNSIILRGYVGLSWIDYIKNAKLSSFLWFLSGVLACLATYFYKKVTSIQSDQQEEEAISAEANQPQILVYHTNYRMLTYDMQSVQLTPMEGKLFHGLIIANNYQKSYEELLLLLWGDKETDKRRLETMRYKLDEKIQNIPGVQINTLDRYGYQLQIPEGYTIQTEE